MLADTPLPHGFGAALASVDTFFPRAPEQFVTSPLCLVGYVRWDARSDRVPPLQTIILSSFPGRTKGCRRFVQNRVHCMFPETAADRLLLLCQHSRNNSFIKREGGTDGA